MIYFLTPVEGGKFIRIIRPSIRPKILIKKAIKEKWKCVAVFRNGMVYDGFLLKLGRNPLRHIGNKKWNREYYKYLRGLDLPTEIIMENKDDQ